MEYYILDLSNRNLQHITDSLLDKIGTTDFYKTPRYYGLNIKNNLLEELPEFLPNHIFVINASNNLLKSLPEKLPSSLNNLNISNNEIKELPETLSDNLLFLDVSYNKLTELPKILPNKLINLNASNNNLIEVPEFQKQREDFEPEILDRYEELGINPNILKVFLYNNPDLKYIPPQQENIVIYTDLHKNPDGSYGEEPPAYILKGGKRKLKLKTKTKRRKPKSLKRHKKVSRKQKRSSIKRIKK